MLFVGFSADTFSATEETGMIEVVLDIVGENGRPVFVVITAEPDTAGRWAGHCLFVVYNKSRCVRCIPI